MLEAGVDSARNEFDGLMDSEAYAYSRSAAQCWTNR